MGAGASARRRKQFSAVQAALAAVRITAFFRARAVRRRAWDEVENRLRDAIVEWKSSRDRSSVRTAVRQASAVRLADSNAVFLEAREILHQPIKDKVLARQSQAEADAELSLLVQQLKEQEIELQRGSEFLASRSFGVAHGLPAETDSGITMQEARCECGHSFRQWTVPIVGHICNLCHSPGAPGMSMWMCANDTCGCRVCTACYDRQHVLRSYVQSVGISGGTTSAQKDTWELLQEDAAPHSNEQHAKVNVTCPNGHQLMAFQPSAVQPQPAGYAAGKAVLCAQCGDMQKPLQNEEAWQRCSACKYDICTACAIAKRGQQAFDNDPHTFPPESFSLCFRAAALSGESK